LHVVDLAYPKFQQEIDKALDDYRKRAPAKTITVSDGHDTAELMQQVDLVSITGSALCNGTLDSLLSWAKAVPRVIVQGQSAAIHPKILFERGVDLVATTLKPHQVVSAAKADTSGSALRPFFEGGLPWIYLASKTGQPK